METVFFVSVAFVAYTYAVYPLLIMAWGTVFPKRVEKRYRTVPVSIVLAVKNEEINIKARIDNLLGQDYPKELVEIIVVSNDSTDETVKLAESFEDDRVVVLETEGPMGKSGALNLGVSKASNDIIVFADARQRFGDNVLAELTALLYDEKVGAVSGELIIERGIGSEIHEGVGLYWQYEKLIRRMESSVDSVVGATGSIYAIRRKLYVPLAPHTLLDDFMVPMRIVLQGSRVIFSRSAQAFDLSSSTAAEEFRRKVRTLAGNFQAVAMEHDLVNPLRNRVFLQFVSHKLMRLAVPYFCVLALVSNLFLSGPFFTATLILQVLFYLTGILNVTPLSSAPIGKLIRVSWTFLILNAAAVVGLWVFLTTRDAAIWKKT